MKYTKNIYLVVLLAFLVSCDNAYDFEQPGRLSADAAFQDVSDLELGILASYGQLDATFEVEFTTTFTDEISIGFDNGGQGLTDGKYGFILNSSSDGPASIWANSYAIINSTTRIIEAAANISPEDGERARYDNVLGEAHAIRAYAHFQLFSYFTTDYTNDGAPCVIAVDFIPSIDQELPRNTNGEVLALINRDLDMAAGLLPAQSSVTFINQDFVTALRARIAAYRGDYATARNHAETLLARYPLANPQQYIDMFLDIDVTEVIFKLERSIGDGYDTQGFTGGGLMGSLWAFINSTIQGSPYFEMGRAVFNKFDPMDVRLAVNLDVTSLIDPNYASNPNFQTDDILVIAKYPGSDGVPLMNDHKIFRASEMLLIKAEAQADANELNGSVNSVAASLKQLRDARFGSDQPLPEFSSQADAFGAILDERRLEFLFEGHRYKDLKRLGERGNREIDRDPIDCAINGACTLPNSDHRWTMPIPQLEMDGNSVIRDQQNPGY